MTDTPTESRSELIANVVWPDEFTRQLVEIAQREGKSIDALITEAVGTLIAHRQQRGRQ